MKNYILKSKKRSEIIILINEALDILESVGVPFESKTPKALESMALSFMAVAGIKKSWKEAKSLKNNWHLTTRQVIDFINTYYVDESTERKISSGSYDDIRRKHLKILVVSDLIINSGKNPNAATNDPTRGYSLDTDFQKLIICYSTAEWIIKLKLFTKNRKPLSEILERKRNIEKISVTLPGDKIIELSKGDHNQLQREIIEEFLPRFGKGTEVLYIGDTLKKILHIEKEKLASLNFFKLSHEELPDIIAYNKKKNWLYLIEAVHSSGTISELRLLELKKLLKKCTAELIFVTAFISSSEFRKWLPEIAWETEVWTADKPDHLVHFNGDKFMGPYKSNE